MRVRLVLGLSLVMALVFAVAAIAGPTQYKVTGGGQVLAVADSSGVHGPGSTITFQAFINEQGEDQDSTGQVNIIDRSESANGKGVHYRGEVDCTFLASDPAGGGYAELQGHGTTQDGDDSFFVVRIRDNGQGADSTDQVEFDRDASQPDCGDDHSGDDPELYLARGNAKIHKQSPSQSSSARSKSATSSTQSTSLLTALR